MAADFDGSKNGIRPKELAGFWSRASWDGSDVSACRASSGCGTCPGPG